jgi:protein involved in polysaccharide export with SLBB domain
MFKILSPLLVAVLAFAAVPASAQDQAGRSEMFNQDPTPLGTQAGERRKPMITNVAPTTAERAAAVRGAAINQSRYANGKLVQQGQLGARDPRSADEINRTEREFHEESSSEFQNFILDNTGKMLPIFGAEFFVNAPSTFAPVQDAPVQSDYILGPGDELLIRGSGTIDIDYRATIDRNGTISVPTVGPIALAGVKAGQAEAVIHSAVARMYKGVTLNVTLGQLRAITVYVVGQASRPGTYTVSSLSTLVTALFASGGPNASGSLRRVQVKRGGKVAAELDLYAFIAKGDKSADLKLQDGDTIYIPPAAGHVALMGKVNTAAIYELKGGGDTVESMLDFAGGLPVVADPRRAFLERIDSSKSQPRSVEQFALDQDGLRRRLKDGDMLNVTSITPEFSNAVVLRGNVDQSIRAPFRPGMRVSDLIPSREYLITRESVKRQNSALSSGEEEKKNKVDGESIASRIGGLIGAVNWEYAVVERVNRANLSVNLIPFNLANVFDNPAGTDNVLLQPGDTVTIFSQQDVAVPVDRRRVFVRIEGEVKVPGIYQMSAGDNLQTLLTRAGGPTGNAYLFGSAFYREQVRKEQEANLEKAAIRLENEVRNAQAKVVANSRAQSPADAAAAEAQSISRFRQLKPTGRIAFGLTVDERSFARLPALKLQDGDRLVVPARPEFVHVFGAVNTESSPLWRPNTRVGDYLRSAGVTMDGDADGAFVMRVDGTVVSRTSTGWFSRGIQSVEVMPGDSIIVPDKIDKDTAWTKFMQGTREWAQIFANFGLGAAAIKTLK